MTELLAWLWQGTLVALASAVLLRAIPRQAAGHRYAVWWLALALVALQPVIAARWSASLAVGGVAAGGLGLSDAARAAGGMQAEWRLASAALPDWLLEAALLVWLAMCGVGLARTAAGLRALNRMAGSASPIGAREERLPRWLEARSTGRRPELRVSDQVSSACAVGLRKPVVLVSRTLAATLDDRQLELIALHEAAHLERYDDWARLAQRLLVLVVGFHPAVRWLSSRLDCEMEAACDQRVVRRTGDPVGYARCLIDVASAACAARDPFRGLAPAAAASMPVLTDRIRRLAVSSTSGCGSASGRVSLACAVALVAAVAGVYAAPVRITVEVLHRFPRVAPPLLRQASLIQAVPTQPSDIRAADVSGSRGGRARAAAVFQEARGRVGASGRRGPALEAAAEGRAGRVEETTAGLVAAGVMAAGVPPAREAERALDAGAHGSTAAGMEQGRSTSGAPAWSAAGTALAGPFTRSAGRVSRAAQSTGGAFSRFGRAMASAF